MFLTVQLHSDLSGPPACCVITVAAEKHSSQHLKNADDESDFTGSAEFDEYPPSRWTGQSGC